MLDRYLLRYFLAVVDHGTFSRAAAQCNVSQPTLSVGIAKLEREVGAALFLRSNQRVQMTDAGSRFLTHAHRIEQEFHAALHAMDAVSRTPILRLGLLRSIAGAIIAAAVTDVGSPEGIELVEGSERELTGHLAKGRIDVALTLVGRGGDRFLEEALMSEGYVLAIGRKHSLAGQPAIAAEALMREVMIVRRHCEALSETSRFFTERGVRPHFSFRATNDERVMQMVAAGLGITVMPESYVHPDIVRPRLAGFTARRTIGLLFGSEAEALRNPGHPLLDALRRQVVSAAG